MLRLPPRSTRTDTLSPYTTLCRSAALRIQHRSVTGTLERDFLEHGPALVGSPSLAEDFRFGDHQVDAIVAREFERAEQCDGIVKFAVLGQQRRKVDRVRALRIQIVSGARIFNRFTGAA